MLNVACSPLSRFVMVTSRPGDVKIKTSLGSSIVFALPLRSRRIGKSQEPGNLGSLGANSKVPLASPGATPFSDCANTVGAAIVSARMTLRANTIARFICPSSYLFVVCLHSHLGEKGHPPCGFDTRFLSLRRFP